MPPDAARSACSNVSKRTFPLKPPPIARRIRVLRNFVRAERPLGSRPSEIPDADVSVGFFGHKVNCPAAPVSGNEDPRPEAPVSKDDVELLCVFVAVVGRIAGPLLRRIRTNAIRLINPDGSELLHDSVPRTLRSRVTRTLANPEQQENNPREKQRVAHASQ